MKRNSSAESIGDIVAERYPGSRRDRRILEAAASTPETFGLRNHAGVFRVSVDSSYVSNAACVERVMLYTQRRLDDGTWCDFAKGTTEELARELTEIAPDGAD